MLERDEADRFAKAWVAAWNAHDLELILSHFSEDVTFTSPLAARIVPDSDGVIHGKPALREYWREGLRLQPELHFELEGLYVGVGTLVINYRNQSGRSVCEVLFLEGGVVVQGHGTYLNDVQGAIDSSRAG
ncbi:MAG: nuclear transport factor 2 family protein [Acidimicrobiales bacterium]